MESDGKLVQRVLKGDESAFEMLVDRYMALAGGLAYQILGDFHLASEVVWEAFLKAYQFLPKLTKPEAFRSWLMEIVRNTALDRCRRKKLESGEEGLFSLEDRHLPEEEVEKKELQQLVRKVLSTMPEEYQELLILKHMEGLSYREIGQRLGMSESAVESKLFRARKLLRERWEQMEYEEQRRWIQWMEK